MTRWNNLIKTSAGEIVDKITILNIKLLNILDEDKIKNIQYELEALSENYVDMLNFLNIEQRKRFHHLKSNLFAINLRLWNVEDKIREKGAMLFTQSNSHDEFIYSLAPAEMPTANSFMLLARDLYLINGERFSLKSKINELLKSPIVEEKSH